MAAWFLPRKKRLDLPTRPKPVVRFSLQWDRAALGPATWPAHRGRIQRLLGAALSQIAHGPTTSGSLELTLRMVGAAESRALNWQFRGKDSPTNVLTFGYQPLPAASADLVLCLPVLIDEARQQSKSVSDHFLHMALHGALHALEFDHQTESEANKMEGLERLLLARFGIPDPYAPGKAVAH